MFLNNKTIFLILNKNTINLNTLKDIIYKLSCKINLIIFGEEKKYEREDVYNIYYVKDIIDYLSLIKIHDPKLIIYVNYKTDEIININKKLKIQDYDNDLKNINLINLKKDLIKNIINNNLKNICIINNNLSENILNQLFNNLNIKNNTFILSNERIAKKEIDINSVNIYLKTLLFNVSYNYNFSGLIDILKKKYINTVIIGGILNKNIIKLIEYLKKKSIKIILAIEKIEEINIKEKKKILIFNTNIIKSLIDKNIDYDLFDVNKFKLKEYEKEYKYNYYFIYKNKIYVSDDKVINEKELKINNIEIKKYYLRQKININYKKKVIFEIENNIYFKLNIEEDKFKSLNLKSTYNNYHTFLKSNLYKNISIYSIFRNNGNFLKKFILMLKNLERENFHFYNYFYENDSNDNTKEILKNYIIRNSGIFKTEIFNEKQYSGIIKQRFVNLSIYRNNSLKLGNKFNMTEWSLIVDSNIYFGKNVINNMLYEYYNLKEENIVMITVYGNDLSVIDHYYDIIAFTNKNNLNFNNKCFFKKCKRKECKKNKIKYGGKKIVEVNSAFAGMCLIKSDVLSKVKWSTNGNCEHINFCNEVRKYGKIIVIPWIENYWEK
jgi:hypothetical protein